MSATEIQIVHGDSKHDMLAQLFDIGRIDRRDVCFTLGVAVPSHIAAVICNNGFYINVWINGTRALNGSGDDWEMHGSMSRDELKKLGPLAEEFGEACSFTALYNTRTRRGILTATAASEKQSARAKHVLTTS